MVRDRFLFLAFCLIALVYVSTFLVQLVIILFACCYLYPFLKKGSLLVALFLLLFVLYQNMPFEEMEGKQRVVRVDEIRNNYIIASNQKEKFVLYNVNNVGLYDVLNIEGTPERVNSTNNLGMFHYATYLQRKNIHYSIYVKRFTIESNANHVKAKLYRYVNSFDTQTKTNMNALLYRNYDNDMDYKHFLYASGVHLSLFIHLLSQLFNKDRNRVGCIVSFVFYMLLPSSPYMIRIFVFSLVGLLFSTYHRREQLGLSIIITLLLAPYMAYEITFIIPVCYRLVFLFAVKSVPRFIKQYLAIIPIQLLFFHEINWLTLFLFPLFRYLQTIVFGLLIATLCFPSVSLLFNYSMNILIWCIQFMPFSLKLIGKPHSIWIVLWCVSCYLLLTYHQKKHYVYLLILLCYQANMKNLTPYGEVTFLDVNQGDCILIREPFNGEVMLIDVANQLNKDLAKTTIYPYLKARGIHQVDKVVITHDDYDHNGGLTSLKKLIAIEQVITTSQDIQLKNIKLESYQEQEALDENDKSIILFTQINQLRYLFMGDASKKVELHFLEQFNKLKVDVLKVAHHGSNTSSDPFFIHQLHPQLSIISSGRNNRYNHPSYEVVETLQKSQSFIRDTQEVGSTSIFYFLNWNIVVSANHEIFFMVS